MSENDLAEVQSWCARLAQKANEIQFEDDRADHAYRLLERHDLRVNQAISHSMQEYLR